MVQGRQVQFAFGAGVLDGPILTSKSEPGITLSTNVRLGFQKNKMDEMELFNLVNNVPGGP